MIYVLYGQPASGKTTLGKMLAEYHSTPFVIDGDEFRKIIPNDNYGRNGREENIKNANTVATYLTQMNWLCPPVVMALVNPYEHLRADLRRNNPDQVIQILLESSRELRKEYHVEDFEMGSPDLRFNTDADEKETFRKLLKVLSLRGEKS
jgi:adenylylsulfate kinase-like enzyme